MNNNQKNSSDAIMNLYTNAIELYVGGILEQYGMSEANALDVVANLTGLRKEDLIQMKIDRYSEMSIQMDYMFDEVMVATGLKK